MKFDIIYIPTELYITINNVPLFAINIDGESERRKLPSLTNQHKRFYYDRVGRGNVTFPEKQYFFLAFLFPSLSFSRSIIRIRVADNEEVSVIRKKDVEPEPGIIRER